MGNVIDLPSEDDTSIIEQKDREYSELQCTSVFNDDYVNSIFPNLPDLDGLMLDDDPKTGSDKKVDTAEDTKLQKLIGILSKRSDNSEAPTFEEFTKLSETMEGSAVATMDKKRNRLLLRIHQAFLHQASKHPSMKSSMGSIFSMSDGSSKSEKKAVKDDPINVLIAMNSTINLSIAKTIGKDYPQLAINIANGLVQTLSSLGPHSLYNNTSAVLRETIDNIYSYAVDIESSSKGEMRSVALGLMLVLASSTGSVEYAMAVVTALAKGTETLPAFALAIFRDLNGIETDLNLTTPKAKAISDKFDAPLNIKVRQSTTVLSSSFTSDGVNLYIWDEDGCTIRKVGTGCQGTIAGNEMSSCEFGQVLADYLDVEQAESYENVQGSISYVNGALYVYSVALLGANKVAVINSKTLKIQAVASFGVGLSDESVSETSELAQASVVSADQSQGSTQVFEFDDSDSVDIRAASGVSFSVTSAMFEDTDCTEMVQALLQEDGTVLHIDDINETLGGAGTLNVHRLTITCESHATRPVQEKQESHVLLPYLTSDGNFLYFLNNRTLKSKDVPPSLFNAQSEIKIKSAFWNDANNESGSVQEKAEELWKDFLKSGHLSSYSATKAEKQLFGDTSGDRRGRRRRRRDSDDSSDSDYESDSDEEDAVDDKPKTFWVNFTVGGGHLNTVAFPSEAVIKWERVIEVALMQFSGYYKSVEVLIVDPSKNFEVIRRSSLSNPGSMYTSSTVLGNGTSIITNGKKLLVQQVDTNARTKEELKMSTTKFDISGEEAVLLEESVDTLTSGDFLASSYCYEASNNLIWSWDIATLTFARWRNVGLRPKNFASLQRSAKTAVAAEAILDASESTSTEQAAVLALLLDKLADPYGPSATNVSAHDSDPISEIELVSKGNGGSERNGFCTIKIRGETYGLGAEYSGAGVGRSYNMATINEKLEVVETKNFDTFGDERSVDLMAAYIESLSEGQVVLVTTSYSASHNMTKRALNALRSLGADVNKIEKEKSLYHSFAFIGRKGMPSGSALQKLGPGATRVVVSQKIPCEQKPLQVEATKRNISGLIKLVADMYPRLKDTDADKKENTYSILLSTFRILTVNVHQWLQGMDDDQLDGALDKDICDVLRKLLQQIIDVDPQSPLDASVSESALILFVEALNLLYPSQAARNELLQEYLKQYIDKKLTSRERVILELMLGRISGKSLTALVNSDDVQGLTTLLSTLMTVLQSEWPARLKGFADADVSASAAKRGVEAGERSTQSSATSMGSLGDSCVQLISSLATKLFSRAAQDIVIAAEAKSTEAEEKGKKGFATVISMLSSIVGVCDDVLGSTIETMNVKEQGPREGLSNSVDDILRSSLIGALLPFFLSGLSLVMNAHGGKVLQWVDGSAYTALNKLLSSFSDNVQILLRCLKKEILFGQRKGGVRFVEKTFESEHEYECNLNQYTDVSIPGARKLVLTFDERTRTESNCDYVRILVNGAQVGEDFSGRDGSGNWPGCSGRPPLELDSNKFQIHFKTDSSVVDWGWKLSVKGMLEGNANNHWLVTLERQLVNCKASLSHAFMTSAAWNESLEASEGKWMADPLLVPEYFEGQLGESEGDVLLAQLADRPEGSLAEKLANIMKHKVIQDQGHEEVVNRAVYATCATLIKHNNLIAEALAVAKEEREDVSPQLTKAWVAGQKMRKYFDLADLRHALDNRASDSGDVQASVYSGADEDVLAAAADDVVARAQLLIRVPATVSDDGMPLASPLSSNTKVPSFLAKQRWNLLAKGTSLVRQSSTGSQKSSTSVRSAATTQDKSKVGMRTIVNEKVISSHIKNVLEYRRKAAERKGGKQSVTEGVLKFIQSRIQVSNLEQIHYLRTQRANSRSKGILLMAESLKEDHAPLTLVWMIEHFTTSLRDGARQESSSKVHYCNALEGCNTAEQEILTLSFGKLVELCLSIVTKALGQYDRKDLPVYERDAWKGVVIASLRCMAMDFTEKDHSILHKSKILGTLEVLTSHSDLDIKSTAEEFLEILIGRCLGITITSESEEPSNFAKSLAEMLIHRLDKMTCAMDEYTKANEAALVSTKSTPVPVSGSTTVFSDVRVVNNTSGYSFPNVALGLASTISLWVYRPRSTVLDGNSPDFLPPLKVGALVMKGADFDMQDSESHDTGKQNIGSVIDTTSPNVQVAWEGGGTYTYKYGKVKGDGGASKIVRQVSLIDKAIQGTVFFKGAPALIEDDKRRQKQPTWSIYGLEMLPNGELELFMAQGKPQPCTHRCKSILPPETWTHVTIVFNQQKNQLYLNGKLSSEMALENRMLALGKEASAIIESPHPYPDNSHVHEYYEFPGATKLTITFDSETRTESTYDFVRFYRDDSHSATYGEDYSGGRGNSYRNFPGLDGREPLVIEANSFVMHFHSDGSNNDWGYKFNVETDIVIDPAEITSEPLNRDPFYIGQSPFYAGSSYKPIKAAFPGLAANMNVWKKALTEEEVNSLFTVGGLRPTIQIHNILDESSCLTVLSQLYTGLTEFMAKNPATSPLSRTLSSPHVFQLLCKVIAQGTPQLRGAALKLCSFIVPKMGAEMTTVAAQSLDNCDTSYVKRLFQSLGAALSMSNLKTKSLKNDHEALYGVALQYQELLLTLAGANEDWSIGIGEVVTEIIQAVPDTLARMCAIAAAEMNGTKPPEPAPEEAKNRMLGLLGFLGGISPGLYPGASAIHVSSSGILEECTIIGPCDVPVVDDPKDAKNKEFVSRWTGLSSFGDAMNIVLKSQSKVPIVVPRSELSVSTPASDKFLKMGTFLEDFVKGNQLVDFFGNVTAVDTKDMRPIKKPITERKEVELSFESAHPYPDCADTYTEISIPGAESMTITFSKESRTEDECDYVRFYKDSRKQDYYGANQYSGRGGSQNFPGCEGRPPLVIPSDSCIMYFHSDGSNNDWGYAFKVKGTGIKTIEPPTPLVLHQLSLLRYTKMLGLKALNQALESFDWMVAHSLPLSKHVLLAALDPMPGLDSQDYIQPVIVESSHPYENSLDQYIPVKVPGAKRLSISFDPQTKTESGCDTVKIYNGLTRQTTVPGGESLTGGKDGSSSNWPGFGDRPPLIVEGDCFEIYFHTDSSVNDWGWKMTVTALGQNSAGNSLNPDVSALNHFYLWQLLKDGRNATPNIVDIPPGANFEIVPAPLRSQKFISFDESQMNASSSTDGGRTRRATTISTEQFKLNVKEVWPKGFSMSMNLPSDTEISLREEAGNDATLIRKVTIPGHQMLASEEEGDWLKIKLVAHPTEVSAANEKAEAEGWLQRRDGDTDFVVRDDAVPGCVPTLVTIPVVSVQAESSKLESESKTAAGASTKHPMYQIDDGQTQKGGSQMMGINPLDLLRVEKETLEAALSKNAAAAAIGFAQRSLASMITRWPRDVPFSIDFFGNMSNLLSFFNFTYESEDPAIVTALKHLKEIILETLHHDDESSSNLCAQLITFCKQQLISSNKMAAEAPTAKAILKVVESKHPYEEDTRTEFPVSIPGAKWLKIVFDERSSTSSAEQDIILIKDKADESKLYKSTIGGLASSKKKHWPGVSGVPFVRVNGDSCMILMLTEDNGKDWGFKANVYGIVEEPSKAELKAYEKSLASGVENKLHPDLACWLLGTLARDHSPSLETRLYTADTLKALGEYFKAAPEEKKPTVLQLLTNMLQSIPKLSKIPADLLDQVLQLRALILEATTALYKKDTKNGSNLQKASRLLQLCIQILIITDSTVNALEHLVENLKTPGTTPGKKRLALPNDMVGLDGSDNTNLNDIDGKGFLRWLPDASAENLETANGRRLIRRKPVAGGIDDQADQYSTALCKYGFEGGVHAWNIKVHQYANSEPIIGVVMLPMVSSSVQIGTQMEQNDVAWGGQRLWVRGKEPVPFGPKISSGDIVSVEIDVGRGLVSFYRNSALVGLAVGPPNSGAAIETGLGEGPFYPAVSMQNSGDAVEFLEGPMGKKVGKSTDVPKITLDVPQWLKPLKEAVALIRSCVTHELPHNVLLKKFLPVCMRKSTVTFECSSFENGPFDESVNITGAHSIVAFFEDVQLAEHDKIRITNLDGKTLFEIEGMTAKEDVTDSVRAALALGGGPDEESTVSDGKDAKLSVGDTVVRGQSWWQGNQDGGAGSKGQVTAIQDWKSKANAGIKVKWQDTGYEGLYRMNYEGNFDLKVFREEKGGDGLAFKKSKSNSLVIKGSYLRFEVIPGTFTDSDLTRKMKVSFVPKFTIVAAQAQPEYEPFLKFLTTQYLGTFAGGNPAAGMAADIALVKHVDIVARAKKLKLTNLLSCKFADLEPAPEDLTRSSALKALVESPLVHVPAEFEDCLSVMQSTELDIGVSSESAKKVKCSNEHDMIHMTSQPEEYDGSVYCDACRKTIVTSQFSFYHCKPCQYDLCMECAGEQLESRSKKHKRRIRMECSSGHEMEPSTLSSGPYSSGWVCNFCRDLRPPGTERWLCLQCHDDYCYDCRDPPTGDDDDDDDDDDDGDDDDDDDLFDCNDSSCSHSERSSRRSRSSSDSSATRQTRGRVSVSDCDNDSGAELREHGIHLTIDDAGSEGPSESADDDNDDHDDSENSDGDDSDEEYETRMRDSSNLEVDERDRDESIEIIGIDDRDNSSYGSDEAADELDDNPMYKGPFKNKYLPGYAYIEGQSHFDTLEDAVSFGLCIYPQCRGVTYEPGSGSSDGKYSLRAGDVFFHSPSGEMSYLFNDPDAAPPAPKKASVDASEAGVEEIKVLRTVEARLKLIQDLNRALSQTLPLIDLCASDQVGSVAALLAACRGLIFDIVKTPVWEKALTETEGSGGEFDLSVSRSKARKFASSGKVDHDGRFMVFSQAFRQIHPMPTIQLRRADKLYMCQLMGERAHDYGGPYRESFVIYAAELQTTTLPLMLQTPNGRHATGMNREKWVLNPGSTSTTHMEMFAFFGKLMGIAIRSKEFLALNIPSLIWKLLVNDIPLLEDLEGVDLSLVKSIKTLRHIDQEGIDAETFGMTFFETFTTTTTDDRIVELIPNGGSVDVTFDNRTEYCDLVLKYRLHEFDKQAAAIRRGLGTIVPNSLLSLFSWSQLETMVCGNAEFDVKLLESVTEYSSCSPSDQHVRFFWQAMNDFTNEERSALLKFTWGRTRLPLNSSGFQQRFKIQRFSGSPADNYFPVAHTCFFSLELPAYSTLKVMKEKLRYAIFNCEAIDGDDTSTGMAVAAMGWEE